MSPVTMSPTTARILKNRSGRSADDQLTYKGDGCDCCGHIWKNGDYANDLFGSSGEYRAGRMSWIKTLIGISHLEEVWVSIVTCDDCTKTLKGARWTDRGRYEVMAIGPPSPF